MKKNVIIAILVTLVVSLMIANRVNSKKEVITDYNLMTPGQLLDIKIDYDVKIKKLSTEQKSVIDVYNKKRWILPTPVSTGKIVEVKETKLNDSLGLE